MPEKSWSDAVVGWFIVKDENDAQKSQPETDLTPDELIAKYAAQTPLTDDSGSAEIPSVETRDEKFVPENYGTPPPVLNGQVDFEAVFESSSRRFLPVKYAGMTAEDLDLRLRDLRLRIGNRR